MITWVQIRDSSAHLTAEVTSTASAQEYSSHSFYDPAGWTTRHEFTFRIGSSYWETQESADVGAASVSWNGDRAVAPVKRHVRSSWSESGVMAMLMTHLDASDGYTTSQTFSRSITANETGISGYATGATTSHWAAGYPIAGSSSTSWSETIDTPSWSMKVPTGTSLGGIETVTYTTQALSAVSFLTEEDGVLTPTVHAGVSHLTTAKRTTTRSMTVLAWGVLTNGQGWDVVCHAGSWRPEGTDSILVPNPRECFWVLTTTPTTYTDLSDFCVAKTRATIRPWFSTQRAYSSTVSAGVTGYGADATLRYHNLGATYGDVETPQHLLAMGEESYDNGYPGPGDRIPFAAGAGVLQYEVFTGGRAKSTNWIASETAREETQRIVSLHLADAGCVGTRESTASFDSTVEGWPVGVRHLVTLNSSFSDSRRLMQEQNEWNINGTNYTDWGGGLVQYSSTRRATTVRGCTNESYGWVTYLRPHMAPRPGFMIISAVPPPQLYADGVGFGSNFSVQGPALLAPEVHATYKYMPVAKWSDSPTAVLFEDSGTSTYSDADGTQATTVSHSHGALSWTCRTEYTDGTPPDTETYTGRIQAVGGVDPVRYTPDQIGYFRTEEGTYNDNGDPGHEANPAYGHPYAGAASSICFNPVAVDTESMTLRDDKGKYRVTWGSDTHSSIGRFDTAQTFTERGGQFNWWEIEHKGLQMDWVPQWTVVTDFPRGDLLPIAEHSRFPGL